MPSLSTTQRYTHVNLDSLMETYDEAHRGRKKAGTGQGARGKEDH